MAGYMTNNGYFDPNGSSLSMGGIGAATGASGAPVSNGGVHNTGFDVNPFLTGMYDPAASAAAQARAPGGQTSPGPTPMPMPNVQFSGGSPAYGGGAAYGGSTAGPNPYIAQQGQAIQDQVNQNLQQNIMPGLRLAARNTGNLGGSRQGIAEGVAAGNASTGLASALANLNAAGYNTDQANQTTRMGLANQYSLGLGNLGLGWGGLQNQATANNQNFYTQQRSQDLQQYQLGSGLFNGGVTGQAGVGAGQYGVGQTGYQAPYQALQQYSNFVSPYTGLNSATQIAGQQNLGVNGMLGSAMTGAQLGKNLGNFWSNGSNVGGSAGSTQNWTYGGSGTSRTPTSSGDIDAILNGTMYG